MRRDGEFGECKGGKGEELEMIDRKKEKEEREKEQTAVRHEAEQGRTQVIEGKPYFGVP